MTLYVIGDSQVSLFTGKDEIAPQWPNKSDDQIEGIRTFRLGSILIQTYCEYGHNSLQWQRLFACLETIPKGSNVLLVFGEIDCRTQLVKQAVHRPLREVARDCAACYMKLVQEVNDHYRVLVWNAPPQSPADTSSNKYPTVGGMQDRNLASWHFNRFMREACEQSAIPFISIFEQIVDCQYPAASLVSDPTYFMDSAHLSQKALPLALEALKPYIDLP